MKKIKSFSRPTENTTSISSLELTEDVDQPSSFYEAMSIQEGQYCRIPQIFHRRSLTHRSKLTSVEKKLIHHLKIDTTVAQVVKKENTYLNLRMLNAKGEWETINRVWVMYITKISPQVFEDETTRLLRTLKKLNQKVNMIRDQVREWHSECGHRIDSQVVREEIAVDTSFRCLVCGKILAVEKKPFHTHEYRTKLVIYDREWFEHSFPKELRSKLKCEDGDGSIVRKRELSFAKDKGWITQNDRDLALFDSQEVITEGLASLFKLGSL